MGKRLNGGVKRRACVMHLCDLQICQVCINNWALSSNYAVTGNCLKWNAAVSPCTLPQNACVQSIQKKSKLVYGVTTCHYQTNGTSYSDNGSPFTRWRSKRLHPVRQFVSIKSFSGKPWYLSLWTLVFHHTSSIENKISLNSNGHISWIIAMAYKPFSSSCCII